MAKYWMIHPELFSANNQGRVFPPVVVKPNPYYNYENDPEYVEVEIPDLPQSARGTSDE